MATARGGEEKSAAQLPVGRDLPPQKLKTPNHFQPNLRTTLKLREEVLGGLNNVLINSTLPSPSNNYFTQRM